MFNIVKFPNNECDGASGKNGTCYTGGWGGFVKGRPRGEPECSKRFYR